MNILLIDDHALFAKSLKIALEGTPEISSFDTLQNPLLAHNTISSLNPDILLLDINLDATGSEDGLKLAKTLHHQHPKLKIVFLTGYDLPVYRHSAQKLGAAGFLNKSIDPQKLISCLIQIHKGFILFPEMETILEDLTDAEIQILNLLAQGIKRKAISKILFISERTLSNHIQHILDKLGVGSSLEAVTKGLRLGYIRPFNTPPK